MSAEHLVRQSLHAFNDRDEALAVALIAPDYRQINMATGQQFEGAEGLMAFWKAWTEPFPDATVEITSLVANDNAAVVEFTGRGTHKQPFVTPEGAIEPTGRRVEIPFCSVWEIRDGKAAVSRTYVDSLTIMRQLGVM
jgi:steroid delta-isomerase-like uncharacterized protein